MTGPTLEEIHEARRQIEPNIVATPVVEWRGDALEARAPEGARAFAKLELFQKTGTFKLRGVLSNLASRAPAELARGVTAVSAGNHAIATAYAAEALGIPAKVVMLATANPYRVERARSMGAEVLIANTYATSPLLFNHLGRDSDVALIDAAAVRAAREAGGGSVPVAGSFSVMRPGIPGSDRSEMLRHAYLDVYGK